VAGAGFLVNKLVSSVSESSRRPAPATPDKEQGEGKKYYDARLAKTNLGMAARRCGAAENRVEM
jgi:hypothetical protein